MKVLAFIPARSGSKTIGMKNMLRLGGTPLVGWVLRAACSSGKFSEVVVSTDHDVISDYCKSSFPQATVVERPIHLRDGKSYPIQDVVVDFLQAGYSPDAVALFQPTSPFVRQYQIENLIQRLSSFGGRCRVKSAYTIAPIPHNYHFLNQRRVDKNRVEFVFPEERKTAWNKQKKDKAYKFGNLVITKTQHIKDGFFTSPAAFLKIDEFDAMDIDSMADYRTAQTMIEAGYWKSGDR